MSTSDTDNNIVYLLPTPLGNQEDITLRVLRLMKELPLFFCEHTQQTRKLFSLYDISLKDKKVYPLRPGVITSLPEGPIGILCDAGLPGISDPGKEIIAYCHRVSRVFSVIPGPSALPLAVVASAFDTHHFAFWGFIPHKKGRQTMLRAICDSAIPVFVYESVHRVGKTLTMLHEFGFTGQVSIAREMSKRYEQYVTDNLEKVLIDRNAGLIANKGEFVLGFDPREDK